MEHYLKGNKMYKVITHTITEEHFNHPSIVEHALTRGNIHPKMSTSIVSNAIINYDTLAASNYRNLVRSLLETYVADVRSAVVSIMGSGEDTGIVENKLHQTITEIADRVLKPYYSSDVVSKIEQHLKGYTVSLLDIAKSEKSGRNVTEFENTLKQHTEELAMMLNTVNQLWSREEMLNYYTWYSQAVKDQIRNRKSKNWASDQEAYDYGRNVMLSGKFPGYSQVLAKGVIAQHADRFR